MEACEGPNDPIEAILRLNAREVPQSGLALKTQGHDAKQCEEGLDLYYYTSRLYNQVKLARPFQFQLDLSTGVPAYRQIIDQVHGAIASGRLAIGDQLPTVRQTAVDLTINPNTVVRAYRELEIRGVLATQQGTGTFIAERQPEQDKTGQRERRLDQLVAEFIARAGSEGFTLKELRDRLAAARKS